MVRLASDRFLAEIEKDIQIAKSLYPSNESPYKNLDEQTASKLCNVAEGRFPTEKPKSEVECLKSMVDSFINDIGGVKEMDINGFRR